jgi:4-carboxymuconolactone decarboxylase
MATPPSPARERIRPHFPKLVEMTENYVFGDVWERPQLSKRDRSLVVISALTALGWRDQLEGHIQRGLDNGLTREEIVEVITHLAMYSGWPSAMTASQVAVGVFDRLDQKG